MVKVQRSRHAHGEGGILALLKQLVFDQVGARVCVEIVVGTNFGFLNKLTLACGLQMRLSQLKAELDIIESDQHEAEEKVLVRNVVGSSCYRLFVNTIYIYIYIAGIRHGIHEHHQYNKK